MIIAISGKIGAGKDLVGKIVQIITQSPHFTDKAVESFLGRELINPIFIGKKFADKLKDIVCLLIGCTREQLEDREFKEKELGKEWKIWWYEIGSGERILTLSEMVAKMENSRGYGSYVLTPRKLLQLLGTECGRNIIHPNIWCNSLMSDYKSTGEFNYIHDATIYPNWIITDLRFPNELKAVKDRDGITIRVERDIDCSLCSGKGCTHCFNGKVKNQGNHLSETSLDNAEFDEVLDNHGTILDLIVKVREILTKRKII